MTTVMGHLLMMPYQLIVPPLIRAVTLAQCIRSVSKLQLTNWIVFLQCGREPLCYAVDAKKEAHDHLSLDEEQSCFAFTPMLAFT